MRISQREARRLRKRVDELERLEVRRNCAWIAEYPAGVHLATISVYPHDYATVVTARKLGHACVLVPDAKDSVRIYASPMEAK